MIERETIVPRPDPRGFGLYGVGERIMVSPRAAGKERSWAIFGHQRNHRSTKPKQSPTFEG